MPEHGGSGLHIDGRWQEPDTGKHFETINPADRKVLAQAAGFALVNVVIGLAGPYLLGVAIGWQAHIATMTPGDCGSAELARIGAGTQKLETELERHVPELERICGSGDDVRSHAWGE